MLTSWCIRTFLALLLVAVLSPPATAHPPRPSDSLADSLYEAGAYDSLLSFASRGVNAAVARSDAVQHGRMLFYRGRARLALRQPGAREDIDRAIAVATAAGDSLGWVHGLGLRAFIVLNEGRLAESILLNERRIAIAEALGLSRSRGWGHLLIGYACLMQAELERAQTEYQKAAFLFGAAGRRRDLLTAHIGLGRVYNARGRLDDARATHHLALELARELGDQDQEGDCWNNLGTLESQNGDLALAADYFRRSYELQRARGAPDLAEAAANLATAMITIGHYAAAESVLVDAIGAARAWHFDLVLGGMYNDLGRLRLEQERPRGAAVYFRMALARGDSATVPARLSAVAGLAEALAAQDSLDAALAVMDAHAVRVFAMLPSMWRSEVLTTWSRCLRAADRPDRALSVASNAFDDASARADTANAVLAALEVSAARRALGAAAEAFAWFDRARVMFSAGSRRSHEYQWREAYRSALMPPLVAGAVVLLEWPPGAPAGDRERALFDFLQEVRARTLMERICDPRSAADVAGLAAMVTADDLQQRVLRAGECLLDISAGRERVYVFAVTRDSLRLSIVDDPDRAIERRARRFIGLASIPGAAYTTAAGPADLLGGVAGIVRGASSIVVVADGWVSSLPFAALPIGAGEALFDGREVSVVPAASLLQDLRARAREPDEGGLLAFAPAGASLPGARREARALASRYRDVDLVDSTLTVAGLAELARRRGILHVATHVHVNSERPWHSGIQAGPDSAGADYLRASEIARADFRDHIVVLSSCESALGRSTLGEGVLGMTSAFLAAGARAVVASLWKVDDRTTSDLMIAFYRGLERGLTAGEALRAAQMAARRERPAPFYWAGFVVVGDAAAAAPLEARSRPRILMVLLTFGVVAAAGAVMVRRRRRNTLGL
ncbi:MAG TPA: CHAT domain-containing tetratricopeptide repeat protein [Candidatus Krumholzibacteria bacterium]|nr:CHAT domain-containing tetratricopeptide repeat protein [Candidatus Krumholzibacteria bacterium]